jgi:dolichyl-phosphate-mannose--protein O-mannosyl transferase
MHFTQTRIATVDVYGVFFLLLMFYYKYQYFSMNFFTDGLKRTLKPLGLAGIFFGLGAASKWICLYAGGGLALILLASFFKRWREYRYMKKLEEPDEVQQRYIDAFVPNIIKTLAFCVVFFIIIPVAIYILSYLPYMLMKENPYTLADVWKNQLYMYSYHSGLKATHPFQSPWWQWPVIGRPILYYVDYTKTSQGLLTTMSAFGNPLVWWGSLVGTIALVTLLIRRRVKMSPGIFLVLVGIAANFIPWTLVSRCVFIYHYFATVPFIIFALVYAVKYLEEDDERYRWVKYALMIGTVLLFAAFYPAIAGVTAPTAYIKLLQWMPSWTFGA